VEIGTIGDDDSSADPLDKAGDRVGVVFSQMSHMWLATYAGLSLCRYV